MFLLAVSMDGGSFKLFIKSSQEKNKTKQQNPLTLGMDNDSQTFGQILLLEIHLSETSFLKWTFAQTPFSRIRSPPTLLCGSIGPLLEEKLPEQH